jgi:hypothetical protein
MIGVKMCRQEEFPQILPEQGKDIDQEFISAQLAMAPDGCKTAEGNDSQNEIDSSGSQVRGISFKIIKGARRLPAEGVIVSYEDERKGEGGLLAEGCEKKGRHGKKGEALLMNAALGGEDIEIKGEEEEQGEGKVRDTTHPGNDFGMNGVDSE